MQARRLGVIVRSSNLCPDCIAEDQGAWKVSWMLVWSIACERHCRLLADVRPSCESPHGFGAQSSLGFLVSPRLTAVPGGFTNYDQNGFVTLRNDWRPWCRLDEVGGRILAQLGLRLSTENWRRISDSAGAESVVVGTAS